jgi:hypothetical protein
MIDDEVLASSVRRRWALPVGVAGAVTATGVAAALTFGGGAARHSASPTVGPQAGSTTPALLGRPLPAELNALTVSQPHVLYFAKGVDCQALAASDAPSRVDPGYAWFGAVGNASTMYCLELPIADMSSASKNGEQPSVEPTAPVITVGTQAPIPADQVTAILHSCMGDEANNLTALVAVRTAIATKNQDGVVIAVDKQGRYVECHTRAAVGETYNKPPYFTVTERPGERGNASIQPFDEGGDANVAGPKTELMTNAGHYAAGVTRVTVSYGTEAKEYPALMKDGVYFLSVSTPVDPNWSHQAIGVVHAYDANGKVLYNGLDEK